MKSLSNFYISVIFNKYIFNNHIVSKVLRDCHLLKSKSLVGAYTESTWRGMMYIIIDSSLVTQFGKTHRFHRLLKLLEGLMEMI